MSSRHHPSSRSPLLPTTRREFLIRSGQGIGLLAFSHLAPSFLVRSAHAAEPAPARDRSILVLVQLVGGNDGLNTLVPCTDDNYYRLRPQLGIKPREVLPLNDSLGLHPACASLRDLFHNGDLAVVQNVGYPNPNRSHFRSAEIWETGGGSDAYPGTGWLGRFLDHTCGDPSRNSDPAAIHLSLDLPPSLISARRHATFGLSPHQHNPLNSPAAERRVRRVLADNHPAATYPSNPFAGSLRDVAALIASGFSTRVYVVSLGGFDTHSHQANQHQNLLKTLSDGLGAFQNDLRARQLDDQVLTMTVSEFGRRPSENESLGTDHGTAAPLFVLGSRVKGGIHGTPASLDLKPNQDLRHSTDFRHVYGTVLENWLQCPAASILDTPVEKLGFV